VARLKGDGKEWTEDWKSVVARCVRDCVKTCEIVVRADVGGVLVAPRLLTCKELRDERATYNTQANVTALFSHSLVSSESLLRSEVGVRRSLPLLTERATTDGIHAYATLRP